MMTVYTASLSTDNSLDVPKWADSVFCCKTRFPTAKKEAAPRGVLSRVERRSGTPTSRSVAARPTEFLCFGLPNRPRRAVPKPPARSPGLPRRSAGAFFRARTRRRQSAAPLRAAAVAAGKQTGQLPQLRPGRTRRDQGLPSPADRPVREKQDGRERGPVQRLRL